MHKPRGTSALHCRMISSRIVVTACGALLLTITSAIGTQISNKVITWGGNTQDWNHILHLGAIRLGCSDPPTSCAGYAQQTAKSQGVDKVFLAILLDSKKTPGYARDYSQLSLIYPALYEVGFDDFVDQAERQSNSPSTVSALLDQVASALKSINPKLRLGITVYEDQLNSSDFPLKRLDESFRSRVDFVHLYPHYRKEAQSFSVSAQQARQLFPNAAIIAGAYAYDRRDYLPCARGNSTPCTNQEEVSLFAQSLKERVAMLENSTVQWLEFYPGSFGSENHWDEWSDPRSCHRDRLQECAANTKAMRDVVRQVLNP